MSTQTFYAVLTEAGLARFANQNVSGGVVTLTEMAVGSSETPPVQSQTALGDEQWRGPIRRLVISSSDAAAIEVDMRIPPEVGGFDITEFGLFDADGVMVAIARSPKQYKPTLSEGSQVDLIVRLIVVVGNSAEITLKLDPSIIMASLDDVQEALIPPRLQMAKLSFLIARNALRAHPLFPEN